ncbi:hypothetical protein BC828DRAFT_374628, partial [Blastocladiella britannica]
MQFDHNDDNNGQPPSGKAAKLPFQARKGPVYENFSVYGPDGTTLLFRCAHKKIRWYLARSLARALPEHGTATLLNGDGCTTEDVPRAIALTFMPRGTGRAGQDWYLEDKRDQCVVCGTTIDLHVLTIVPPQYRKHMPVCVKSHSHADALPVCSPCAARYNTQAHTVVAQIAAHYGIPEMGAPWIARPEWTLARKAASPLVRGPDVLARIPAARIAELRSTVAAVLGIANDPVSLAMEVLVAAAALPDSERGPGFVEHGEGVVRALLAERDAAVRSMYGHGDSLAIGTGEKVGPKPPRDIAATNHDDPGATVRPVPLPLAVDPLYAFVVMWRQFFLASMTPAFMSPHYSVEADVYNH